MRITGPELDRLIAGAPAQARSLVETQGYFNAQATARRDGIGNDGLPQVLVELDPGPRTTIAGVELETQGPIKQAAQAQDANRAAPDRRTARASGRSRPASRSPSRPGTVPRTPH